MDRYKELFHSRVYFCALAIVVFWAFVGVPLATAQFKLPKVPKLPKVGEKKPEPSKEEPKGAHEAPEVLSVRPDSFPPGGAGEVMLTGKNFFRGMRLRLQCRGDEESPEMLKDHKVKVESPEKAVVQIAIPFDAPEGPCALYSVGYWAKAGIVDMDDETGASRAATPEVMQIKTAEATFSISNSSKVPVSVPVVLLAEGDLQFMELMMKMQEAMMPGFGEKGEKTRLLLSPESVKYVQGEKVIFSEPASGVKEVSEMTMQGQSMGIFRISFRSGKICNFMASHEGSSEDQKQVFQIVKKKLGK